MHVDLSNFEIQRNSSSKIWRNNTCYGCHGNAVSQNTRTSPLVRVQLFQKLGGWMLFVILKISHILCFYIQGSILYLHFCYTLYIYIYIRIHAYIFLSLNSYFVHYLISNRTVFNAAMWNFLTLYKEYNISTILYFT